jgi:pimeloyl-ACP methyl ester carboxylesterase
MKYALKKEGKFSYTEIGEGRPIIILHGLMGGLSNFDGPINYFSKSGYKLVLPKLPVYDLALLNTNVKNFAFFLRDFIDFKGYEDVILLGNSLGGHIGLYYTNLYPTKVAGLVIHRKFRAL